MFLRTTLLASILATSALGHLTRFADTQYRCSAPEPTVEQLEQARELAQKEKSSKNAGGNALNSINVDVVFHVVAEDDTYDGGYLSDKALDDQFDVMTQTYAPYNISFNRVNTTRTINAKWSDDKNDMAKKKALRQGDYKTLNIYFQKIVADGALGLCYFPEQTTTGSDVFYRDGCSIRWDTVPGSNLTGFNLGKTVTHEAGHWFNLFHTFQGGCASPGDHIADTPAEASPASGCPTSRDTCTGGGLDPVHNYMDYSSDECYEEFTAGQKVRIYSSWTKFRANS